MPDDETVLITALPKPDQLVIEEAPADLMMGAIGTYLLKRSNVLFAASKETAGPMERALFREIAREVKHLAWMIDGCEILRMKKP
jgi:hypothetical protein